MILRSVLLAAVAAVSFSAQAGLAPLTTTEWPPVPSDGIEGVLFNKVGFGSEGEYVALGAHAYKNSALLPNDGTSTFDAASGIYAPDGKGYANWSFDFAYNLGTSCTGCRVVLGFETDFTTGSFELPQAFDGTGLLSGVYGSAGADSWNLMMAFFATVGFDPNSDSSTDFSLWAYDANGGKLASTEITVNVKAGGNPPTNNVPEPGTLALVGLALAGVGLARRRMTKN